VSLHRAHVAEALGAISIQSRHRFTWLGESSPTPPRALASVLPAPTARALLVRGVAARLYESFYCTGGVVEVLPGGDDGREPPDAALVATLSTANAGLGSWQHGWRIENMDSEGLVVTRDGVRAWAGRSECRADHGALGIGAEVSIALPPQLPALSPGFLTLVGDVDLSAEPNGLIARVYFNVSCAAAPRLVGEVTSAFDRARIPFRLKVINHPERFGRCDAAVLYMHAFDFRRTRRLLRRAVEACVGQLQPRTPVFTKPLAPGVGLGEERGSAGAESFGTRRCLLVATGVVEAHEERIRDLRGRLSKVERCFADAGIDIDAPYLERGSEDRYSL
jgi:HopA1 effector protein family